MRFLLLAFLLQSNTQISLPKAPPTIPPQSVQRTPGPVPQIAKSHLNTTPDLDPTTELTHVQMEHEITVQEQTVIDMKAKVDSLEKLRADPDRKDIEDLKKSRDHIEWTWGILSTVVLTLLGVFGTLYGKFRAIIWEDSIKPRIKKYLSDLTSQPQP